MATSLEALGRALEPFPAFLAPDELDRELLALHDASGGRTTLEVIGESTAGHPLQMLTVGAGSRHALALGMPHPNEPTGALAQLRMIELLLGRPELVDQLGLAWHFIPCADPDGARLNQRWFGGPFDRLTYASHLYRPTFEEQFEWTFHRSDLEEPGLSPTSESSAVMQVIDALRPELLVSMHNAEVGGMFCYVTDSGPDLSGLMSRTRTATGLPYELGDIEGPVQHLGPGIHLVAPNLTGGAMLCSTDYAGRYGAFGVTTEPPMWADPTAEDTEALGAEALEGLERLRDEQVAFAHLLDDWRKVIEQTVAPGPRYRALMATHQPPDWMAELETPSIGAQLSATRRVLDLERTRGAGQVVALLNEEVLTGGLPAPLQEVLRDARGCLADWVAQAEVPAHDFVGLDGAVRFHVGIALGAASALADL